MAKGNRTCDHCHTEITEENRIIAKLFLTPALGLTKVNASDYHAHMDIGQCCTEWLTKQAGEWQTRRKRGSHGRVSSTADALAAR